MKKYILITGDLFIRSYVFSQNADSVVIKKIVDETMTHSTAYENLRKLCKQVGQGFPAHQHLQKQ
ncbi:MAG: hypothetical protein WKF59_04300 [Chitinophagaceae bacterium]